MENNDGFGCSEDDELAGLSADILRGRQSVRATFRLPVQVIALLSVAAHQLGLKQKSLFDQLVEDRDVLARLAQTADQYQRVGEQRQQKTYVVSRNALLSLEYVAKACGLPRDLLVELSIQRLVPVVSSEQEKQRKRRQILERLSVLCLQGANLQQEASELLGEDDSAVRLLHGLHAACQRTVSELAQLVTPEQELERYQ
jgi:hypothetical protein